MAVMAAPPEAQPDQTPINATCSEERIDRLEAHVAYLSREVALLRASTATFASAIERHSSALGGLSRLGRAVHIDGEGDVVFSGINVRIQSASPPWTMPTGKGNLILGYDSGAHQITGEHNIVVGPDHHVAGRNSLIVGAAHTLTGTNAVALGGVGSEVGSHSATLGGLFNGAPAAGAVIVGGRDIWVHGENTVSIGGRHIDVDAKGAVILGGID